MQQDATMAIGAPKRALNGSAAEAATPTPGTWCSNWLVVQQRRTIRPRRSYHRLVCSIRRLLRRLHPSLACGVASCSCRISKARPLVSCSSNHCRSSEYAARCHHGDGCSEVCIKWIDCGGCHAHGVVTGWWCNSGELFVLFNPTTASCAA